MFFSWMSFLGGPWACLLLGSSSLGVSCSTCCLLDVFLVGVVVGFSSASWFLVP